MTAMRRLALLLTFSALPMLAQPTDYSIYVEASRAGSRPADRIAVGETVIYDIAWDGVDPFHASDYVIEVDVPGVVTSADGGSIDCTTGRPVRCTFVGENVPPRGFLQVTSRMDTAGTFTTVVRIIGASSAPDANPSNNSATHTFAVIGLPSLRANALAFFPDVLQPGQLVSHVVSVDSLGGIPATNVVATVTLPAGGTIASGRASTGNASCSVTNDALVCTAASLGQGQFISIEFEFFAPARMTGEDVVIDVVVTSSEQDAEPEDNHQAVSVTLVRQFVVTTVADEGSGSLRQALHDVNALCPPPKPCAILFHLPPPLPRNGWFTIQPRTPLPEVTASLTIDGHTQTLYTGNTNLDGPEVELDGSLQQERSGLVLRPYCELRVHGLAVNGFPSFGIEVQRFVEDLESNPCVNPLHPLRAFITGNYLGVDPHGLVAKPNQRGVGVFTYWAAVTDNLISHNERSGIYAVGGYYADISRNSLLHNGAGIFLDLGETGSSALRTGADIVENVIAYNDMSIARTRHGDVHVTKNSILDNVQQGIDADLDAATPNRADDRDLPNHPVLFSATYDPARDATIVRGRIDSEYFGNTHSIEVYASAHLSVWGGPQAERSVATEQVRTAHQDFEIVIPLDLRGQWITATHFAARFVGFVNGPRTQDHQNLNPANTSELSNAVFVQ